MDADIYNLIANYGFKNLHTRLIEIMKEEYDFLHNHFTTSVINVVHEIPPVALAEIAAVAPIAPISTQVPINTLQEVQIKKPRKYTKKAKPNVTEPVNQESDQTNVLVSLNPEVKDVVVTAPVERGGYRDPKEVKAYQKAAENERRRLNEQAGIQISQVLTKENLKKWIEVEGRTYAWVAREKAGCADTQVAATAQMMGIKSTISKKRGIMMGSS